VSYINLGEHQGDGIRYSMHLSAPAGGAAQMLRDPEGNWVGYAEYAALQAENERLREKTNYEKSFLMETDRLHAEFKKVLFDQVVNKNALLEAEVERLRKAGDAIKLLHTFGQNLNEAMDNAKANAAKEVQS
jgi:hypothetical protein